MSVGINGTHDLNQLYAKQQESMNILNDTNTQKLNEMLLTNQNGTNPHAFTNGVNPGDFPTNFNSHDNYLNKLLLQKQNLAKQSLAAPPGFGGNNNNNMVFNSPISTSSSSASSTSSSVNNSTSTTPALNSNLVNNNSKASLCK